MYVGSFKKHEHTCITILAFVICDLAGSLARISVVTIYSFYPKPSSVFVNLINIYFHLRV